MANPKTPPAAQVDPSEGPFDEAHASQQEDFDVAEADGPDAASLDEPDEPGAVNVE